MAYTLTLTDDDLNTIAFVGHRYGWSNVLRPLESGENEIAEWYAWDIRAAIDEDMEGGHSAYPMLDPQSDLAVKLTNLYQSIV